MQRLLFVSLLTLSMTSFFSLSACTGAAEGEGEGGGEGEGEGSGAEGEGEGAGEGEGEGAGEGEGEGAGEGEGEGAPADGTDRHNPTAADLSTTFTATVDINPADDEDCFSFTASAAGQFLIAAADDGTCATFDSDPFLTIYDATDLTISVDSNDDSGPGFCPLLNEVPLVDGHSYVVCVSSSSASTTLTGVVLTMSIEVAAIVASGDVCNPASTVVVCDTGLTCLSFADVNDFRCGVPTTIAQDGACIPGVTGAVCDPAASPSLSCLSVTSPTDFKCEHAAVLVNGDACVLGATAAVCDANANLACADDGSGTTGICQNAATAECAQPVVMDTNPFTTNIGSTDALAGTCTAVSRSDTVLLFHTDATALQRITVTATGATAVSIRTSCLDDSTELGCNTTDTATALVTGNSDLILLVESETAGAAVTVSVTSVAVTALALGDVCDPASTTAICDPSAQLACSGGTCQPDVGNTAATATAVDFPFDVVIDITSPSDVDCFSFTAPQAGSYTFKTVDSVAQNDSFCGPVPANQDDPLIRLENPDGTVIASDDDSSPDGFCSLLTATLAAGPFVLCVEESGRDDLVSAADQIHLLGAVSP